MNLDFLAGLVLLGLLAWGVVSAVWLLVGWLARRLKLGVSIHILGASLPPVARAAALDAATAPPATPPQPTGPVWQAMVCGRRLELGSTGFYVSFDPTARLQQTYELYTPEDELVAFGPNLQALKALGESMARDRAEFTPPAAPAGPWKGREVGHG